MSGLTRQELADRSGTDLAFVDWLVDQGMLRPAEDGTFPEGRIRIVQMTRSFQEAGIDLEQTAPLVARGELSIDYLEHPAFDRLGSLSPRTFRQLADDSGVPLELLMVIREAMGAAQPLPDDRVRDHELEVVPFLQAQIELGFGVAAVERLLRVYGDTMRRISETEADWWTSEFLGPRFAQGLTPEQLMQEVMKHGPSLADQQDHALNAVRRGHQAHQWTETTILSAEAVLSQAGLHSTLTRPPAVCFLDLTGYTRLTQERGDQAAAQTASDLSRMVQRTSVQHDGRPVKWLGDGVMFYFRHPGKGVLAALAMVEGVGEIGLPPAHVGLHAGPVLFQDGDYFGQTVVVASRIADFARAGEVLVSDEVVAESEDGEAVAYTDIGPVELKGLGAPIRLHAARRSD
jgi:adenylate cyclase